MRARISLIIIAALLGAALAVSWLLPKVLIHMFNNRLLAVPGYRGKVERVNVEWLRPGLKVQRLHFDKQGETPPAVFLSIDEVLLDISWDQLLRGRLVLDISVEKPQFTFLMRQTRVGDRPASGVWQAFFGRWPPFRADRVTLNNAVFHIRNDQSIPPVHIYFDGVHITATNMANRKELILPGKTRVDARGLLIGSAPISLSVEADPFRDQPTFSFKGELKDFDLVFFNDFLLYYLDAELESGRLDVSGQFTAENGGFTGNAHRRIENLRIKNAHRGAIKRIEELLLQGWMDWHEGTQRRIQDDFRLSGPFGYMDDDVLLAAVWVARSVYIESLKAKVPGEIRLQTPEELQAKWAALQALLREERAKKKP